MVEWSISLQPQEELAAFARFGNAVASLCVEKKGARACLKNHFRNLQAPLCGIFYPHSVAVARYAALIRIKSPTNWDSQLTKSLFQTRSRHTARIYAISKNSVHRETNSNLATFPISYYDGAERKCSVSVKILSSYHVRTETERGHTYENRTFIL